MTGPRSSPIDASPAPAASAAATVRLGCVSFLNARPLIEGMDGPRADRHTPDVSVRYDVPSRLLADLEQGEVDLALCPVIDYQRSTVPLALVPAGGIGCEGPTLTVRLYSRVPFDRIHTVHVDTDSHTSVCLLRILLDRLYGCRPGFIDYDAGRAPGPDQAASPPALLLIGDKVVHAAPPVKLYPHQLDLGQAWHELTGGPFVFAVWMVRQQTLQSPNAAARIATVASRLAATRVHNARRIDAIVAQHAADAGWPADLAADYLGRMLRYEIGPRQMRAIEQFHAMAYDLELIDVLRPVRWVGSDGGIRAGVHDLGEPTHDAMTPAT
jgi:chorismate dehydratase